MKVACPTCKLIGNIRDEGIPDKGKDITCPKCGTKFVIRKTSFPGIASGEDMKSSPYTERMAREKAEGHDLTGSEIRIIETHCQNCHGPIRVPENKQIVLCPHCGANIIKQVVPESNTTGLMGILFRDIGETGRSAANFIRRHMRRRGERRISGFAVLVVIALVGYYTVRVNNVSSGSENITDKRIDINVNLPTSDPMSTTGTEDKGFFKDIIQIDVTSSGDDQQEEVRVFRIVFKDGTTSDYFRYFRYSQDMIYISLPAEGGGYYEMGYPEVDVRSLRRAQTIPDGVKIYGVN